MKAPTSTRGWITTNIVGGLGNQLFLIANLLATARRNRLQAVLPQYAFSSSQDEPRPTYWASIFAQLPTLDVLHDLPPNLIPKPREVVVPERRPAGPIVLADPDPHTLYNLVGFFQSDQFFLDHPLKLDFVPTELRAVGRRVLVENYLHGNTHAHVAALHVRRGDYLKHRDVFETLEMPYYDAALRQLFGYQLVVAGTATALPAPLHVLVFCDEEKHGDLAVGYLSSKYRGLQVTLVHPKNEKAFSFVESVTQPREVIELLMMTQCNDVVMANSTFSWWGAYLNDKPLRRTVAPSKWFVQHPYPQSNHLYCADWILL